MNTLPPLPDMAPDISHDTEALRVQVATLQAENRRLRRLTQNGKQGSILHRAAADARAIVAWRAAGYSVARRKCLTYGLSERRWMWAMALLKLANVIAMDTFYADDFLLDDLDAINRSIDRAVGKVERNGMSLLLFRMPKGRAKGS